MMYFLSYFKYYIIGSSFVARREGIIYRLLSFPNRLYRRSG